MNVLSSDLNNSFVSGVGFGYPHIMHNFMDDAFTFINAYNLSPETQKAIARGLMGDIPFVGKSPVELD